jgi:anti-anti-sigma regulatory factor
MVKCINNVITLDSDRATLEDKTEIDAMISSLIASGAKEIHVDLGSTSYLPSELMGLFMWKKKELVGKGISLRIIRISESLYRIFDTAMIIDFFNLDKSKIVPR